MRPWAAALLLTAFACGGEADREPPATGAAFVQPGPTGPDVWVADLSEGSGGLPGLGEPANITPRPGYDNQPHFTPDGSGFWYTAVDESIGQADIWRYDFGSGMVARVTSSSPESEYSASPLPDGSGISVVRVEADSMQRLWRFDGDGANGAVVLDDLAPVGYYAWADENTVVAFVLGPPATLQRADVRDGVVEVLATDIGPSVQRVPGTNDVSFVQRHDDGTSTIMRLPYGGAQAEVVASGLEGGDHHAWTPDGTLLMAHDASIHAWVPDIGAGAWRPIADFSGLRLRITRLAVSPDGSQIAFVGEFVF